MKILNAFLNPGISPAREAVPPKLELNASPLVPQWGLAVAVLKSAGLPDGKTRTKLDKLGEDFVAELAKQKGHSFDDARHDFRNLIRDALDGKSDSKMLPTKDALIKRNSLIRQVARNRASEISREGCLIAADVLEKALGHLPKFCEQLLASELAIHQGIVLPGSPLKKLCEELPAFIKKHISKLRDNKTPMTNPSQLLK